MRGGALACLAVAAALAPLAARAVTLDQAIDLALKHDPGLRRVEAERDAAHARLDQARGGRLPTLALQAAIADAPTGFGPFFGFGRRDLQPRTAGIELRQPLFTGGAVQAAIQEAKAGETGARYAYDGARRGLVADVAAAFEDVRIADQSVRLEQRQVEDLTTIVGQAQRRFEDGETPHTDLDEAQARLAAARADLARAQGGQASAGARYAALVGEDPVGLEAPVALPNAPANVNEAVAEAEARNPDLAAASSAVDAAEDRVRKAKAEALPTVALVAGASSIRDEFFPGYRADAASIGVEGRWTLFNGAQAGKVSEAVAEHRAAQANLDRTRSQVREAAIEAWHGLATAGAVADAAGDQSKAADAALTNVREEVRVGEKPTIDLLNAEREALAARIEVLRAEAAKVVAAYRLAAVTGS